MTRNIETWILFFQLSILKNTAGNHNIFYYTLRRRNQYDYIWFSVIMNYNSIAQAKTINSIYLANCIIWWEIKSDFNGSSIPVKLKKKSFNRPQNHVHVYTKSFYFCKIIRSTVSDKDKLKIIFSQQLIFFKSG